MSYSPKPPYLSDKEFLKIVDHMQLKEQYIKLVLLDWQEREIDEVQGYVQNGSISVNGQSSVRRTLSLTVTLDDDTYNPLDIEAKFSANKKIKVFKGFKNTTKQYNKYDILWFPQGVYVITGLAITQDINMVSLSVTACDKMCLLNGDVSGALPAAITFDSYDTIDEYGNIVTVQVPYYNMIRELINHWGGEQLENVIINGVPLKIRAVIQWVDTTRPVYVKTSKTGVCGDITTEDKSSDGSYGKYVAGDDIGYTWEDFVYTGKDGICCNVGASITSVLDTIVSNLGGNYEYFYDIDGNFIFQEKRTYENTTFATAELTNLDESNYYIDMSKSTSTYDFDDSQLLTAYNNNPQLNSLKNDFVVWGKTSSKSEYNLHYRLVIDEKPVVDNDVYHDLLFITEAREVRDENDNLITDAVIAVYHPITYTSVLFFPNKGEVGKFYIDNGASELAGEKIIYVWSPTKMKYVLIESQYDTTAYEFFSTWTLNESDDWRTKIYLDGVVKYAAGLDAGPYWEEMHAFWPQTYNVRQRRYRKVQGKQYPDNAVFYIDIIGEGARISQLSVSNIGRRQMAMGQEKVNCIFERDVPEIIYVFTDDKLETEILQEVSEAAAACYDYVELKKDDFTFREGEEGPLRNSLAYGGSSYGAYEVIKDILYQYTGYNETITLTGIPIYYLEPNTRIYVSNPKAGIQGEYVINSISLPLDSGQTMSISATRVVERERTSGSPQDFYTWGEALSYIWQDGLSRTWGGA